MGQILKTYDSDKALETVEKSNVEIFAAGTFNGDTYAVDDLYAMVDAFDKVGFQPPIKAGHEEGQEDKKTAKRIFGEPALGYVTALRVIGDKLYADLKQIPKRFADLINAGAYKRISSEVYWQYTDDSSGKTFPRVLKAIAFLGANIPALTNLKAIESLYQIGPNGQLMAYEGNREFRVYNMDMIMPSGPKKDKVAVGYVDAKAGDAERCSTCKFYSYRSCGLVEGEIEPSAYCNLYEMRNYEIDENRLLSKVKDLLTSMFRRKRDDDDENDDKKDYTIEKRDGKWCLISKSNGETLGCHPSKEKAIEQERAIKANMEKQKESSEAKAHEQGGDDMDAKEIQELVTQSVTAALKAQKDEMTKEFEAKLADAKSGSWNADLAESLQKAKSDARKEAEEELRGQIDVQAKQLETIQKQRRSDRIQLRIDALKRAGKIPKVWEQRIKAVAEYLKDDEAHAYTNDEKKRVEEPVIETFFRMFETSPLNLFRAFSVKDDNPEDTTYSDPLGEVQKRLAEYMKETGEKDMAKAYSAVFRNDPALKTEYDKSVTGRQVQ